MKYNNINELHQAIEKKAKKIIKCYYSDYKNYDRLKVMQETGKKGILYMIFRQCGSYAFNESDIKKGASYYIDYYKNNDSTAKFYKIDFNKLTIVNY
jgi:hypothetical protein